MMADATPAAGVPTFDASQIQGLLAQFGPTQAMKDMALRQALMSAGFGLMGMVKGGEGQGAARAGLLGMGAYNDSLKQQLGLQQQGLSAAMPLFSLQMKQNFLNQLPGLISGQGQPGAQPAGNMLTTAGPPAQFSSGVNAGNAFGGGMPAQPQSLPTQQPMPSAPPYQGSPGNRAGQGLAAIGAKMMFGQDITPALQFADPNVTVSRTGVVSRGSVMLGQMLNDGQGFIAFQNGDPSKQTFYPGPQGVNQALASKAGAIAGSQAQAKAPYDFTSVPMGGGSERHMTDAQASQWYANNPPPGLPNTAPAAPSPGLTSNGPGVAQYSTPSDAQARQMIVSATRGGMPATVTVPNGGVSMGAGMGGPGLTPTTAAIAGAKAAATTTGENLSKYEQSVHDAAQSASTQSAQLTEMAKLANMFTPSATLPERSSIANFVQDVPGVGRPLANALVGNSAVALPAVQGFTKLAVNMIAAQAKVFGSREAVQIVDMIKNALPNVGMVPGAPQTILGFMAGMNKYAGDTEQAMSAWKQAHGGSIAGFQEAWHATSPATKYVPPLTALAQIAAGEKPQMPNVSNPLAAPASTSGWSIKRIN